MPLHFFLGDNTDIINILHPTAGVARAFKKLSDQEVGVVIL